MGGGQGGAAGGGESGACRPRQLLEAQTFHVGFLQPEEVSDLVNERFANGRNQVLIVFSFALVWTLKEDDAVGHLTPPPCSFPQRQG